MNKTICIDSEYYWAWWDSRDTQLVPDGTVDLTFGWDFDQPLWVGAIPDSVVHLTFGIKFNEFIEIGVIPNSVEHLTFEGGYYMPAFVVGSIPNSVKSLSIEGYSKPFDVGIIPESVKELDFGDDFDQPIMIGVGPNHISYLEFEKYLKSSKISFIPKSVSSLRLYQFNSPIVLDANPDQITFFCKKICHTKIFYGEEFYTKTFFCEITYKKSTIQRTIIPNPIKIMILPNDYENNYVKISHLKNVYSILFGYSETICTLYHTPQFQEELVEKVFDPIRIQRLCDNHKIDLYSWIDFI